MKIKEIIEKKYISIIFILLLITIILSGCKGTMNRYNFPYKGRDITIGLENFLNNHASRYKDKKAVIITNHSGTDNALNSNIILLREKGIKIEIAMAPEHGLYGYQNVYSKKVSFIDKQLNITIYNLHKVDKKKFKFLINDSDFVIFDIQDMGMRCYTYISNLKFVMDVMDGMDKKLIVFDRPNPIGFLGVSGPYLSDSFKSKFVGSFPVPLIYNMTIGEAALYYRGEFRKGVNLEIIKVKNYSRNDYFNELELPWVPPSPNLPTYKSAIIYTALVLLEGINFSLGRGTSNPFEFFGAPWIEPAKFCKELKSLKLKNFKFRPLYFKPTFGKYKDKVCGGAQIFYTGGRFNPVEFSYKVTLLIKKKYKKFKWKKYKKWYGVDSLAGTDLFRKSISMEKSFSSFQKMIKPEKEKFKYKRKKYLLY